MANFLFNLYSGERNIYLPRGSDVPTAAPTCHWPPNSHDEPSIKQSQGVTLCQLLTRIKNDHGVACSALQVGDKIMLEVLPSHSRLHSFGVNVRTGIAGLSLNISRLSARALVSEARTRVANVSGVCTPTNDTQAAVVNFGATSGVSDSYWFTPASSVNAVPDVLMIDIVALPAGGLCPVGTSCCDGPNPADIRFQWSIDNAQH